MAIEPEPRVLTIEGHRVRVFDRRPPLPATLDVLLAQMTITARRQVRVAGWRASCSEQDHRLAMLAEGLYLGPDGIRRSLRLSQCVDCESVQVRDVSLDRLDQLPTGGQALRRRDLVLGWYSGRRRFGREYQ